MTTIDSSRAHANTQDSARTGSLHVEEWGTGTPVVLVHGSLATGAEEWDAQRPLAEQGFKLKVLDRRGYGHSPVADGEDFEVDADDIVGVMGDGAHLVGHSYGGLGVMLAAARRPDATKSLTLLEPPASVPSRPEPAWQTVVEEVRNLWDQDIADREWVTRFLKAVGSDPDQFPAEFLEAALPLVPVFRRGRPFYAAELPFAELAAAGFPKFVVSGGHSIGFDRMCDALARSIGASRAVIEGAGHEIQFTGPPINDALLTQWRSAG